MSNREAERAARELARLRAVEGALADLMRLKDGPRDDAYRREKDAAWETARLALNRSYDDGTRTRRLRVAAAREARVVEIQRTRLGGVDRITIDDPDTPPYKRYAHIMSSGYGTNLYTTDDPETVSDAYRYEGSDWRLVGVIDLDTGDVVDDDVRKAIG